MWQWLLYVKALPCQLLNHHYRYVKFVLLDFKEPTQFEPSTNHRQVLVFVSHKMFTHFHVDWPCAYFALLKVKLILYEIMCAIDTD